MASCDPDSFLLSPSAPPHWHSGITSERGRDEREGEKHPLVREEGEGECVESELIMEKRGSREEEKYRGYCEANLRITPERYT